ncbi:MAG: hypothetical protein MJD61_12725 [Proteobacteria bacterium]|nr:hypothetical protein [Pseudomonadota bacterium]
MTRFGVSLLISGIAISASLGLVWEAQASDDECKAKGACPLHDWMESNLKPATKEKNTEKMAELLAKVEAFVPDPAWKKDWLTIAQKGAEQAKKGDYKAARRSCKGCHKKFRKKYQATYRSRKLAPSASGH